MKFDKLRIGFFLLLMIMMIIRRWQESARRRKRDVRSGCAARAPKQPLGKKDDELAFSSGL